MFVYWFCLSLGILVPLVHSQCLSQSSDTWICSAYSKSMFNQTEFLDYEAVLNNKQFQRFFLTNYHLSHFRIDNYPLTLRLFNASGNSFSSLIITSKHRSQSNLRQLIFQSNHLQQLDIKHVFLPESLERISFANNELKILDARLFTRLNNLIELDLRNNHLKRILPELLLRMNVQLNNNPLECQCTPESYQVICHQATNIQRTANSSGPCMAPYYDREVYDARPPPYLRFSTFVLTCPINSQPAPFIIWSTPFGTLTSTNSSSIDLLATDIGQSLYISLTALTGPLTTRTRHTLRVFNSTYLSVTRARASLQDRFSCSGINMLGTYTHHFAFSVQTNAQRRALWELLYTLLFGVFIALIGGALCVTLKQTNYYPVDHMKTPPIYPTQTPNSASRTPPNFEVNQWLTTAAANISGTLEQVRDKLRCGVQQVNEQMGRASEIFSHGVQQAAVHTASYLQSFRETTQQYLNTVRVQTLSSIRTSGQFMRAGMNSLRDYCGVTTGVPLTTNYLLQQQQQQQPYHSHYSPSAMSCLRQQEIMSTIAEEEMRGENEARISSHDPSIPYVGHFSSEVLANASGIGQLERADNSVLLALNNFHPATIDSSDVEEGITQGRVSAGIGTFHGRIFEQESERFILN